MGLWGRTAEAQKAELLRSVDGESFTIGSGLLHSGAWNTYASPGVRLLGLRAKDL